MGIHFICLFAQFSPRTSISSSTGERRPLRRISSVVFGSEPLPSRCMRRKHALCPNISSRFVSIRSARLLCVGDLQRGRTSGAQLLCGRKNVSLLRLRIHSLLRFRVFSCRTYSVFATMTTPSIHSPIFGSCPHLPRLVNL